MRENRLIKIWEKGQSALNGWLHIPSSWSAEVMAHQGYDSLTIDFQHGFHDISTALTMLQAISTTNVVPLVRVPLNDPAWMMRLLDAGAYGVICPMVNSGEECRRFVQACRYHPEGNRSLGPTRARIYGGADYAAEANHNILTLAMVETREAMSNLDDICNTPGLDGVYVGPGDLSLSLGGTQRVDVTEPDLVAAQDQILAAAQRQGIVAGLHTNSSEYANKMIDKGWQFVTVKTDSTLLASAANSIIQSLRQEKPEQGDEAAPY